MDVAPELVKRRRSLSGLLQAHGPTETSLMGRRLVRPATWHPVCEPFFGTGDRSGIGRRSGISPHAPMIAQRLGSRQKPPLVLAVRHHHRDGDVSWSFPCPTEEARAKLCWTVAVGIDKDQQRAWMGQSSRCHLDCLDQQISFNKATLWPGACDIHPNKQRWINLGYQATDEQWQRLFFTLPLDDTRDLHGGKSRRSRGDRRTAIRGTIVSCSARAQVLHLKQLARSIQSVPQNRASDVVNRADRSDTVFSHDSQQALNVDVIAVQKRGAMRGHEHLRRVASIAKGIEKRSCCSRMQARLGLLDPDQGGFGFAAEASLEQRNEHP
jgi:hypothetical protein